MTIESYITDISNASSNPLYIEYNYTYIYEDKEGKVHKHNTTDFLHLLTFTEYTDISCLVLPNYGYDDQKSTCRYMIRIALPNDTIAYINSTNKSLINAIYRRILANEDSWISDIEQECPEVFV